VKLLVTVIPKSEVEAVSAIIGSRRVDCQTALVAEGTATSEILEMMSLATTERVVLFSLVEAVDVAAIYADLVAQTDFLKSGMGVAFTIPISAMARAGLEALFDDSREEDHDVRR